MQLAGQKTSGAFREGSKQERELGAQLLLSEVLEYVIKGLGVTPTVNGTKIEDPNGLDYKACTANVDELEMLDGLADVAYTMYWNSEAFGLPLEKAFDLVCDNNLEKFVALDDWQGATGALEESEWHCNCDVTWPEEVASVTVLEIHGEFYAAGKDKNGKVRKPSHYTSVDLKPLLEV